jgi:ABC-type Na+ transport system ATPase subunit NatA
MAQRSGLRACRAGFAAWSDLPWSRPGRERSSPLDEPTNDVDPLRRRLLWEEVRRLAEHGAAVVLVTHNVMEAEKAVDRLALIDQGRLLAEARPPRSKPTAATSSGCS